MVTATLPKSEIQQKIVNRVKANAEKMRKISDFMMEQVQERYRSAGSSGGTPWPATATPRGHKPPLQNLEKTWSARNDENTATVASDSWIALVQHLGTQGKGGDLPTIVPKHAAKLFVPLTDKGLDHYLAFKQRAPVIRHVYAGTATIEKPKFSRFSFVGQDDAKYGVDWILCDHVDLPPRKQIPSADVEREKLGDFVLATLKGNP